MSIELLRSIVNARLDAWRALRFWELQFKHSGEAQLLLVALVALSGVLLVARLLIRRRPERRGLVVPAVLVSLNPSYFSFVRHTPLLLFLAGVPFVALALADPWTPLVKNDVTYPGRRISVLVDASASMLKPFKSEKLNTSEKGAATFFTAVAAAERFVRMRIDGQYRDLLALVEFGNEAYVVTPFTNDYDNILLSLSLIGDPVEFSLFPDPGTIITNAIDQSVALFRAFNFLDASGNAMVLFTDGEDTRTVINGRTLDEIMVSSIRAKVPVYMVRTNYGQKQGSVIPDEMWRRTVERTGGRFFAADSEARLLSAIEQIDNLSAGTIRATQYSSQRPQFAMFALLGALSWIAAAASKLTIPAFRKIP